MKKTYFSPSMETFKIQTVHLMASSGLTGTITKEESITESDGFGSRFFNFDDEDIDEE